MAVNHASFCSYFFPVPPNEWTAETILQTEEFVRPLQNSAQCLKVIGGLGALFTTCKVVVCLFSAVVLSSTVVLVGLTSMALIALGMGISRLVASHYKGLTSEHRLEIALEELKAAFDQLPVFESEVELQQRLADDLEFDCQTAERILEKANKLHYLAVADYRPTKQIQPRLHIFNALSLDQQKDLLEVAYQKGIILEFASYHYRLGVEPLPDVPGRKLDAQGCYRRTVDRVQQGAKLAVDFLENCLIQDSDSIDIKQINTQLYALGYTFVKNETKHVLNPVVYMESEDTLVIRGNFSEIDDLPAIIDRLAPHVKNVKIERRGLLSSLTPALLNVNFAGKMTFVDELDDMPSIWQTAVPLEPGLKEIWKDIQEDTARKNAKKG